MSLLVGKCTSTTDNVCKHLIRCVSDLPFLPPSPLALSNVQSHDGTRGACIGKGEKERGKKLSEPYSTSSFYPFFLFVSPFSP